MPRVGRQFLLEFSKTMPQNVRVEDVEGRQINYMQHPQGLFEIQQKTPRLCPLHLGVYLCLLGGKTFLQQ